MSNESELLSKITSHNMQSPSPAGSLLPEAWAQHNAKPHGVEASAYVFISVCNISMARNHSQAAALHWRRSLINESLLHGSRCKIGSVCEVELQYGEQRVVVRMFRGWVQ